MSEKTELSDEQLSLKIAESIEPKPDFPCPFDTCMSMKGVWEWVLAYGCAIKCDWFPCDMVNDAEMTLLLIDGLRPCAIVALEDSANVQFRRDGMPYWTGEIPTLGRAVAEAYATAKGLI
jgi:hypothetical protein